MSARRFRRLSGSQARVAAILGPLDGARIPGGCHTCDAYQSPRRDSTAVWVVTTYHDDWCPTYKEMKR